MANQEKTRVKQQYFIPLEVKEGTIITKEFEDVPRTWSKIGNRRVYSIILILATKEQYEAYTRPEWKEDKRQQRLDEKRWKREKAQEERREEPTVQGWDTAVSFEHLCEREYEFMEEPGQMVLEGPWGKRAASSSVV